MPKPSQFDVLLLGMFDRRRDNQMDRNNIADANIQAQLESNLRINCGVGNAVREGIFRISNSSKRVAI